MNDFPLKIATKRSIGRRGSVYGEGVNDAFYIVNQTINGKHAMCPIYQIWVNMLRRCYCPKYLAKNPTYKGCSVAKEWLVFSCFREWVLKQDYQGKELDKDILAPNNKKYSPEVCVFVSHSLNLLLAKPRNKRSYPTGVSFEKRTNKFYANCKTNGEVSYLGCFSSASVAAKKYREFKAGHVAKIAILQNNMRIRNGLLAHSNMILNGAEC